MSELDSLQLELAELETHISGWRDDVEEWSAEWMTRQSLLQRQVDLYHRASLLEGTYELEVFLQGDAVRDSAVEADFLGDFLGRLQKTLSAIIHDSAGEPGSRGSFPADVLAASRLQLVATGSGSFKLAFAGPNEPVQSRLGDTEVPTPPLGEALDKLMTVIEAAEDDPSSDRLRGAISELGGHRAIARTVELSQLLGQWGTGARFVRRPRFQEDVLETRFSVPVARRLGTVLEGVETTQETLTFRGVLSGVRWTTHSFDLETDGDAGEVIQGTVVEALRGPVREAFDRHVEVTVVKTTVRTAVEGEASSSYLLIDLSIAGEEAGFRLPGIDE